MAQLVSASGLGPEGPVFESQYPDFKKADLRIGLLFFIQNHITLNVEVIRDLFNVLNYKFLRCRPCACFRDGGTRNRWLLII